MSVRPSAPERSTPRPTPRPVRLDSLVGSAPAVEVTGLTADSRLVHPGDLYVGLPGHTVHGARFAAAALDAGAVAILTDEDGRGLVGLPAAPVVTVDRPREQLARLAVQVYGQPATRMRMFGLTGTNGKTTTSYLLEAAARACGLHTGLIGTIGFTLDGEPLPGARTTITTPEAPELQALLAVMAERGADAVVMEVSSHALALGRADGVVFDVAGFTNLGSDHLDFHGDVESYFEAKALLFTPEHARHAVLNVDDPRGRVLAERARSAGLGVTTVSLHEEAADYSALEVRLGSGGSSVRARTPAGELSVQVPLPGDFNVRNALTALAMVVAGGSDPDEAAVGIVAAAVPGRMQPVRLGAGAPQVVVDFAHTPQAVSAALGAIAGRRRIAVLGSGGDRDPGKRLPMGAAATTAEVVVITDDNPRGEDPEAIRAVLLAGARDAAHAGSRILDGGDRRSAIRLALELAGADDVVVVLGKGHEAGQEIAGVIQPFDDVSVVEQEWAGLARGQEHR